MMTPHLQDCTHSGSVLHWVRVRKVLPSLEDKREPRKDGTAVRGDSSTAAKESSGSLSKLSLQSGNQVLPSLEDRCEPRRMALLSAATLALQWQFGQSGVT